MQTEEPAQTISLPVANMDERVLTSGYSSSVAQVGANLHFVEVNGKKVFKMKAKSG